MNGAFHDLLPITALGMCTSLGDAVTAAAAARAGLARPRPLEHPVFDPDEGEQPATGHPVPCTRGFQGHARLVTLAWRALEDLLRARDLRADILARIWDPIAVRQGQNKCFSKEEALAAFRGLSDHFRKALGDRAGRGHKVQGVLARMKGNASYSEKDLGSVWWLPFSMAKDEKAKANPLYDFDPVTNPDPRVIERRQKIITAMKGA